MKVATVLVAVALTACTTVRVQRGGPSYQVCKVYTIEPLIDMSRRISRQVTVCKEVDEREAQESMR